MKTYYNTTKNNNYASVDIKRFISIYVKLPVIAASIITLVYGLV